MKNLMKLIIFSFLIFSCTKKTQIVEKPVYIKPEIKNIPQRPQMEKVEWNKIGNLYCIDKENAKKLLKNPSRFALLNNTVSEG